MSPPTDCTAVSTCKTDASCCGSFQSLPQMLAEECPNANAAASLLTLCRPTAFEHACTELWHTVPTLQLPGAAFRARATTEYKSPHGTVTTYSDAWLPQSCANYQGNSHGQPGKQPVCGLKKLVPVRGPQPEPLACPQTPASAASRHTLGPPRPSERCPAGTVAPPAPGSQPRRHRDTASTGAQQRGARARREWEAPGACGRG